GEAVALDRVLIAARERDLLQFRPALQPDGGRAIDRRIEGNLDLDASVCPDDIDALMPRKLRGAREGRRRAGEIEPCGRRPSGSKTWIPVAERDHARGLAAEDEPGHGDAVAADVHERTAAGVGDVPDVLRGHG